MQALTIKVNIQLKETSMPITHYAENTYTKGPLYCVYVDKHIYKYPIANI